MRLTVWEEEGPEEIFAVELVADGDHTTLVVEVRGIPLDLLYAYGAGRRTWRTLQLTRGTGRSGLARDMGHWRDDGRTA